MGLTLRSRPTFPELPEFFYHNRNFSEYLDTLKSIRDGELSVEQVWADYEQSLAGLPEWWGKDQGGWAQDPPLAVPLPDWSEWNEPYQLRAQAEALARLGLEKKATRLAACGRLGRRVGDDNGHAFWVHFRCGLRFCPFCAPRIAGELFHRHLGLEKLIVEREGWTLARLDFMFYNPRFLPEAEVIRRASKVIKRVIKRILKGRRGWGYLYCFEFGFDNTNLHAHGVYYGPYLDQGRLSALFLEESGDSFIVSIKREKRSFRSGLRHLLEYVRKPASDDPQWLAALEKTFHGAKRVHALGIFYNPKLQSEESPSEKRDLGPCPYCQAPLSYRGAYCRVAELEAEGLRSLDEVRRELAARDGVAEATALLEPP